MRSQQCILSQTLFVLLSDYFLSNFYYKVEIKGLGDMILLSQSFLGNLISHYFCVFCVDYIGVPPKDSNKVLFLFLRGF